jgi:hypothetical protein
MPRKQIRHKFKLVRSTPFGLKRRSFSRAANPRDLLVGVAISFPPPIALQLVGSPR